jgi:hypothetical protein
MPPRIQQHVRQRTPRLVRRPQHVQVKPIREYRAAPVKNAVHRPSEPRAYRLHPARQISRARRFDDQMRVIPLHGVVRYAEAAPFARNTQRAFKRADQPPRSKRRNPALHLQRHVTRIPRGEWSAARVRVTSGRARLATRAIAPTTPTQDGLKIESELSTALRHDWYSDTYARTQMRSHDSH